MGVRHVLTTRTAAALGAALAALMRVAPTAAQASQSAKVRFVQASPGASAATLKTRVHGHTVSAGTASTAIVAGSAGQRERVILATDSTKAPSGAPKTGFGGLASGGGVPWALALLAALVAGTLGAATHVARARRTR